MVLQFRYYRYFNCFAWNILNHFCLWLQCYFFDLRLNIIDDSWSIYGTYKIYFVLNIKKIRSKMISICEFAIYSGKLCLIFIVRRKYCSVKVLLLQHSGKLLFPFCWLSIEKDNIDWRKHEDCPVLSFGIPYW